jgi:hypothetical protein
MPNDPMTKAAAGSIKRKRSGATIRRVPTIVHHLRISYLAPPDDIWLICLFANSGDLEIFVVDEDVVVGVGGGVGCGP